ncbi:MAG TPA: Asp-tRNA(Asn)/Glu-tRNA(Gln) amidotransferase subunit GatC [Flavobacteriales bacterium]|nr:Asp-tRNA(Asn)/Glu-tRNA(Gln) amidotransferase subunit GatC [Flavobacteriales bacterium]
MSKNKVEINDALIEKLCTLAKLEYNAQGREEIKKDLTRILGFIDKLDELDTANVEPLIFMSDEVNVLRADEYKETVTKAEALKNAPSKDSDYFKVPKVLSKQ